MKFRAAFLFVFLLTGISAAFAASPYYVPPGQLNATVQIAKSTSSITATFSNATSGFSYDKETGTFSGLRVAIDARSIDSSVAEDKDAFFDLLDVALHPAMNFVAPDPVTFVDGKGSVKGMLTVHGVSKPVTLDATVDNTGKLSRTFGISFHGSFKRADFGIADPPNAPKVYGDTITLQLDMQAIRQ